MTLQDSLDLYAYELTTRLMRRFRPLRRGSGQDYAVVGAANDNRRGAVA